MRIALVIEKMDPHRGGRERSVVEIASELARRGHDVTILCRESESGVAGVKVMPLACGGTGRADKLEQFCAAIRQVVDQQGYDIVHATLPVPGANVYQPRGGTIPGQLAAKARRFRPLGRAIRQAGMLFNPKRRCESRLEKQIVADSSVMCLGISQMVLGEFTVYYGRSENVRLVYSGVEVPQTDEETRETWRTQWRRRWGIGEKIIVFLTIAHNFALKGVAETIEAFADWKSDDARLVIIGGGSGVGAYLRRAGRLGVGDRVVFEDAVANIFELYSAADAVVLLSWQDACSRVVLEAIRWGLPSLTTRFNGAAELLARGAGIIVESPRDRAGIIAGMAKLSDPKKRRRMVNACLETADFAANKRQVDELEKIYTEIAG
ncbi:MAG: glycosyltransferase family 4 protein [Planctomycetota bacterium]|nr:glycosyltransferase family 4 protein [Planctomycetota bacterium]